MFPFVSKRLLLWILFSTAIVGTVASSGFAHSGHSHGTSVEEVSPSVSTPLQQPVSLEKIPDHLNPYGQVLMTATQLSEAINFTSMPQRETLLLSAAGIHNGFGLGEAVLLGMISSPFLLYTARWQLSR